MNETVNWLPTEGQPDTKTAHVELGNLDVKLSVSPSIEGEVFYGYHGKPELPILAGEKHMGSVIELSTKAHVTAYFTVRKVNYRLCLDTAQGKASYIGGSYQLLRVGSDGYPILRDKEIPKGGREAAKTIEAAIATLLSPIWKELRELAIADRRKRCDEKVSELQEAIVKLRTYSALLDKTVSKAEVGV